MSTFLYFLAGKYHWKIDKIVKQNLPQWPLIGLKKKIFHIDGVSAFTRQRRISNVHFTILRAT